MIDLLEPDLFKEKLEVYYFSKHELKKFLMVSWKLQKKKFLISTLDLVNS